MRNKLLTMVLTLSMLITCIGLAIPMSGQASTEGFSYDSTNFSTLDLTDKTGFSLDEGGNLVMSMQAETTSGSQLSLGGNGVSGENVRFKMIYRDTTGTGTAQYYQTKSFLQGGGFFDLYKQQKMCGSLQMSSRVINNNAELFKPSYSTVLYYNTWIIDMNTVTGVAEYTFWQCTSLEQAQGKTDSTDTLRRVFNGTATTKGTVNTALTDFILSTKPSVAGTATDIIVYEVTLEAPELEATPVPTIEPTAEPVQGGGGFEYDYTNFKSLNLTDKTGFSLDEGGNLVMSMQAETTSGSQLSLGGNGVSGENVRFKIIYRNTDSTATAQYYGAKSFVKGGGFFDLYKQGSKLGSLQMSERVIYNAELFNSNYDTTLFYNTLVIDMNTITGEAKYAFWQCTSLEQAKGKIDTSGVDTVRQKAYGTGTSASGANQALGEIILNTQPIAAGTSTDIVVYEVSLDADVCVDFNDPVITQEADGSIKAIYTMKNITSNNRDYAIILAAYDENNKLIRMTSKKGTLAANTVLDVDSLSFEKPTKASIYKAFVWEGTDGMRPLNRKIEQESKEQDEFIVYYYPGYTNKAVTFSYDDGLSSDKELVELFNAYNIKSTFNLVGKFAPVEEEEAKAYVDLYEGHEVANHSQNHPKIGDKEQIADLEEAICDIVEGRDTIESYFGNSFDVNKWGFVWPYGRPLERGIEFVEALEAEIKNEGAAYIRPVTTTGNFDLPQNWMLWQPTSKDDDMIKYTEEFLIDTNPGLRLLFLWGHASDLRTEKYGVGYDDLEDVIGLLTSDSVNIWSATNMEIYDYVNAVKSVEVSDNQKTIINPSNTDVYAVINNEKVIIPANGSYTIK